MFLMAWRSSRGLIPASMMTFLNSGSKTGPYRISYRMFTRCGGSATRSTVLLQEQGESLGSGREGGMKLQKGG